MSLNKIKIRGVLSFAVFPFLILHFVAVTRIGVAADYDVSASVAKFSSDLYSHVIQYSHGNLVISPLSLQILLTNKFLSATGKTKKVLENRLYLPSENREEVATTYEQIVQSLQSNSALKLANKLFVRNNQYHISRKFKQLAGKLDLDIETLNSNADPKKIFNDWINFKTNNKFEGTTFFHKNRFSSIQYLSALTFKGHWAFKFNDSNTKQQTFWESETALSTVDMMHIKAHTRHSIVTGLDATAIELPFTDGNVMVIILPNERSGLAALEKKLKGVNLNDVPGKMTYKYIDLSLPKFNIGNTINMTKALEKMGLSNIFNTFEFTGVMRQEKFASGDIAQVGFIEVNEDGAETTQSMYSAEREKHRRYNTPLQFKVDHPFFYMVKNSALQTILFVGRHTC